MIPLGLVLLVAAGATAVALAIAITWTHFDLLQKDNERLRRDNKRLSTDLDASRDLLEQSYALREAEAIEWAEQVREVTAIALSLDVEERMS